MINSVAIVGYGIAGSAAALFLARNGVRVSIFEGSAPDADAGAGLLLQAPAIAVLRAAGLDAKLMQLAAPIGNVAVEFAKSKRRFTLAYDSTQAAKDLSGGTGTVRACGIQRSALSQLLRGALDTQTKDAITWNTQITSVDTHRGLLTGQTSRMQVAQQTIFGPFDLIIGADGVNSSLRSACTQIQCHRHQYPMGAIVCLADLPDAFENCQTLTQYFNAGSHVSVWPVGASAPDTLRRVTIALPVKAEALAHLAVNPNDWLMLIQKIQPKLAAQLAALPNLPKLIPYRYSDVTCSQYFSERVVLIGDAAHAMSPQLGLGASLALLDAWHLAKCVQNSNSEQTKLSQALTCFEKLRRSEANKIRRISRIVTPFFQSANPLIDVLREPAMRAFANNAIIQRFALKTLCQMPTVVTLSQMEK